MKVEIVGADHQNKPDVGSNIVRKWIDTGKVAARLNVGTRQRPENTLEIETQ